ncbi:MAG: DpnI domain-containing protein [Candidatus Zixiibacteriota bacterium]
MNPHVATGYKSGSQIARRMTEDWCLRNVYCAACDTDRLDATLPNTRAYDFSCGSCGARYQLKAGIRWNERRVPDAAYDTMVQAIQHDTTPNLLLLQYTAAWTVRNLMLVPRFFLNLSCIEKRKPLGASARRAGWVGCNICLTSIAPEGKLPVVDRGRVLDAAQVRDMYGLVRPLSTLTPKRRGWTVDVLRCVHSLGGPSFELADVYAFESQMAALYPGNRNVRAKMRQQLQELRDMGLISFLGGGRYRFAHSR